MKTLLKSEETLQWLAAVALLVFLDASWYWYLILFLGPDIAMLGYVINSKVGAWSYNLFHHKGVGAALALLGLYTSDWILLSGIAMLGHSAMDRVFGYGLKYEKGFKFTHLGEIGRHG